MTGRAWAGIALALVVFAVAGSLLLRPAQPAPAVTFKLIDGRQLATEQLRGRAILVNFWSTSCPSCIAEMPDLVSLHRDFSSRGLTIVGVAMPYDPPNRVLEVVAAHDLPYPIALDLDTHVVRAFGNVRATPTHFLIGPDGLIQDHHVGPLRLEHTRQQVARLLEES
jgi:peroxiredoxin